MTRRAMALGGVAAVAACGRGKFVGYAGPEVTRVEVHKGRRRMYLLHNRQVLTGHDVQLGFAPHGHKMFSGDGRTPEGRYIIDRRNPNSDFYLSIGIDYPNQRDRMIAAALGKDPGGDIFVHGWGPEPRAAHGKDWTAGCIAVTDEEMRQVYAMVRNGTPIDIYA
jgi:murein L,D-transpeptidase YafK